MVRLWQARNKKLQFALGDGGWGWAWAGWSRCFMVLHRSFLCEMVSSHSPVCEDNTTKKRAFKRKTGGRIGERVLRVFS